MMNAMTEDQGKSKPPAPRGCTVGEIVDDAKAKAQDERRREMLSEILPSPTRIMNAADCYSTAAAKIFLEAAMRTGLGIQRKLWPGGGVLDFPPAILQALAMQTDAHRRSMRDAYLTAAIEMLRMLAGDFEPEPWNYGEAPEAGQSSKVGTEERRICELYHQLTDEPDSQERTTNNEI